MLDQEARLERLLARHRDATVVTAENGRTAMIRRDQILVAEHDVAAVEDLARRWYDRREDHPGLVRLRLRAAARVDVCELAAQLSGDGRHRRHAVAPNHLVHGQPLWWSGAADLPRPVPPLPAPCPPPPARANPCSASASPRRPVTVAILDTGLAPHPWYESSPWYQEQREEVAEIIDAELDYELDAQAGHGTFVAGVLLQRAPCAVIRAKRVIGGDGIGDELDVVRALTWLAHWGGADIVNLSAGCHTYDDRPSPVVARAITRLGHGTVVVACAGNTATDRPYWPAALKPVIAVAALDAECADRAAFSNYGWWVDAAAPGVDVRSCFLRFNGCRPRIGGIDPDAFEGYASWSGTSFAAPAVAGAIADLAEREGLPGRLAAERIIDPQTAATRPDLGVIIRG